jgi:cytochrome c2
MVYVYYPGQLVRKKKSCFIFFPVIINIFFSSCSGKAGIESDGQTIKNANSNNTEIRVALQPLLKQRTVKTVHVLYDDYFKGPKEYLGYEMAPIIDSIIKSESFDTTRSIIIFECHDGYKPSLPIGKLYDKVKPYIVYKDLNEKGDKNWNDSIRAKFRPYYLVWDSAKKEDNSFVWPYGLISITLTSTEAQNRLIYPFNNSSLVAGFNLFRNNCIKCHSLNGVGGSMAPEFNFPKNITEYWKGDDIISFARNPKSYRRNSTMPAVTGISDSDYKEIILYLKYMKEHKVDGRL